MGLSGCMVGARVIGSWLVCQVCTPLATLPLPAAIRSQSHPAPPTPPCQVIIRLPGTYDAEAEEEEEEAQRRQQDGAGAGGSEDAQQQQRDWSEEGGGGGDAEMADAEAGGGGGGGDEWGGRADANATLRDVFGSDDDDL